MTKYPIDKSQLEPGTVLDHRNLGKVVYTTACRMMEARCGSPDTIFVEHDCEVKEVTLKLVFEIY